MAKTKTPPSKAAPAVKKSTTKSARASSTSTSPRNGKNQVATSRSQTAAARPKTGAAAKTSARKHAATPQKRAAVVRGSSRAKAATPKPAAKAATRETSTPQQLAHQLSALLHTMQTIQQFEEKLCSMMHAMRRGRPSAALERELLGTLQELPVAEYRDDVQALLHGLR